MTKYACNEEGVQALNATACALKTAIGEIQSATSSMNSVADDNKEALGPHAASLKAMLGFIKNNINSVMNEGDDVVEMLMDVADGYQDVIDNPLDIDGGTGSSSGVASGGSSGAGGSSGSSGGGFFKKLFSPLFGSGSSSGGGDSNAGAIQLNPSGEVIGTPSDIANYVRDSGNTVCSRLPANAANAISYYTGNTGYRKINAALRGQVDPASVDPYTKSCIGEILDVMADNSTATDITAFRGCGSDALQGLASLSDSELLGKHFSDGSFTSTSLSYSEAVKFYERSKNAGANPVMIVVDIPKGTHGLYVDSISVCQGEDEFLLDAGQTFVITAVSRDGSGRRVIRCKVR